MEYLVDLILLFFIYSFTGWCIEVTLKYIQYHRLINRGFFTGPVLPIYGSGALLITLAVGSLRPVESACGTTFALSFLLCGMLEYTTSWVMEKRFHARWWDYSGKPMNLNGRIWIGNLILFGLAGVAVIHLINPLLYRLLPLLPLSLRQVGAGVLTAVFLADYAVTHFVLRLVKTGVENSRADSTEQISREIRLLLTDRPYFYRRFADAYPDVIYRTERINARLKQVREETERLRQEAEKRISEKQQQLASALEPTAAIRSSLIREQGRLIDLLYRPETATEEEKQLKARIDADKQRLVGRPLGRIADR